MSNQIVVAGAVISGSLLLVAQRARPPELAGLWELPGGKVAAGESDAAALARELREELGVEVTVGPRIGADVALNGTTTLRAYRVTQTGGTLHPNDHRALRWIGADELEGLAWVPADRAWVGELTVALQTGLAVRRAVEADRAGIAAVVVEAYRREFSTLSRKVDTITAVLTPAVEVDRFFVADGGGDVIGAVACTDRTGRAMRVLAADWRSNLGLVRGTVAARILAPQWISQLDYPDDTGYIEFVAVAERARRQGIATRLIEGVIAQTRYTNFELEVTDVNVAARDCYRRVGFVDVNRKKEKFGRIKGFRERIYMHYTREPTELAAQ
ncbi:acetyltransferase (GNAT) family protein [Mycolicibacterium moriokaense]|uniref:8-oxo-dGTP diphosphatase n=1 Tax=Mycolicibacterium moriokaense TaxID=39691 RepID=A0A318HHA0_9MYCO|nr:acetyltransferase (GNAT) family protein [Mycolicibacterium moriokaense]